MAEPESKRIRKIKFIWMAEPESKSKSKGKIKFFWMAEPGHPHEVGVLHNRTPAAGTHKPLRKEHQESKSEDAEKILKKASA
jgi:hypothetical protein